MDQELLTEMPTSSRRTLLHMHSAGGSTFLRVTTSRSHARFIPI